MSRALETKQKKEYSRLKGWWDPWSPWEVQALSHSELLWEEKKYSYKNCFQDTSGMFLRFWVQIHLFSRIQPNPALWTPHLLLTTGSRGDVFVVRTSKPVENLRKNGLFWSRNSFVTHSIDRKPRDWGLARSAYSIKYFFYSALRASVALRATCCAPARIWLAVIDFQKSIIVYSRFIKMPLG